MLEGWREEKGTRLPRREKEKGVLSDELEEIISKQQQQQRYRAQEEWVWGVTQC